MICSDGLDEVKKKKKAEFIQIYSLFSVLLTKHCLVQYLT